MNRTELISYATLVLMLLFLATAFVLSDGIASKLAASFGIITGAFALHMFSKAKKEH